MRGCWVSPCDALATLDKSKQRSARLQARGGRSLAHRLVLGFLGKLVVVGGQRIDEALVGVARFVGEILEDLALLAQQLCQALHRASVELRVIFEGLHPVLEEPPRELYAALLGFERPVHGRLVRLAGELVQLLSRFLSPSGVLLVHRRPPLPRTHMITLPKPSGGAVVLRCSEPVLHWIVPRKIASMDRGEPDLGPSRRGLEDIGKQPSENKIAVIGGDGIGPEVVEAGIRVLEAATEGDGSSAVSFTRFPWGCEYYLEQGRMMPEDGLETLAGFDAIYLGAVGWPTVPDHISLWGLLLPIRRGFDQYVNLRPARLLRGVESPLARPGSLDVTVVRENTEGEYSDFGGRMYRGTPHEVVIQESIFTRRGVERIVRYAYEEAGRRRGGLVGATKSNGISITMPFFDEVFREVGEEYPDVEASLMHADALAARLVLDPERFDVIVGSNLLGDILSEVTAAASGAIGIAPSGNLNPEREYPSLFEPIHGSAPDIAGEGVANPAGAIWAGAMMLEQVGRPEAGKRVLAALEKAISGGAKPATSAAPRPRRT